MCVDILPKENIEMHLKHVYADHEYVEKAKETLLKAAKNGIKIVKWSLKNVDKGGAVIITLELALKAYTTGISEEDLQKAVVAYTLLRLCSESYKFFEEIEKEIEKIYEEKGCDETRRITIKMPYLL